MATETEEAGPEVARDGLLRGIGELRAFDVSGIIPQLLLELPTDERASQTTWDTIIGKLTARQYTTYAALHSDVLAATGVLAIPDKKRSKLQKACGKVLKDMRKAWHGAEVKTRMQLYEWHPGGPTKAHEVRHGTRCRVYSTRELLGPVHAASSPTSSCAAVHRNTFCTLARGCAHYVR